MTQQAPQLQRLDVRAFAARNGQYEHTSALGDFPRLAAEIAEAAQADVQTLTVHWRIAAELRHDAAGQATPWLHCQAETELPLSCQRCLQPASTRVESDQWFRFVATEAQAEREDEESEEDVLALETPLDVLQLIEDDLLLALPPLVKHTHCEAALPIGRGGADAGNVANGEGATSDNSAGNGAGNGKPPTQRPFADLAQLLTRPLGKGGENAD